MILRDLQLVLLLSRFSCLILPLVISVVLIRPSEVKGFCFCGAGVRAQKETYAISCMHGTYDIEDIGSMDLGVPRLDIYKAGLGH